MWINSPHPVSTKLGIPGLQKWRVALVVVNRFSIAVTESPNYRGVYMLEASRSLM